MSRENLEEHALALFAFLEREHQFSKPIVTRRPITTTIAYLSSDIAIEFAFDWRERDVAVALVRLEDGRMPSGYYVSKGYRCREYLVTWLAAQGRYTRQRVRGQVPMTKQLEESKRLVEENIALIKSDGLNAFGPAASAMK